MTGHRSKAEIRETAPFGLYSLAAQSSAVIYPISVAR